MKIVILNIMEIKNQFFVKIKSEYGEITGEWMNGIPMLNHTYDVEFDSDIKLKYNDNIFISNLNRFAIWMDEGKIVLNGQFDSLENDCLAIRLGGIILLDFYSNDFDISLNKDNFLKIIVPNIQIYNTNLS